MGITVIDFGKATHAKSLDNEKYQVMNAPAVLSEKFFLFIIRLRGHLKWFVRIILTGFS